MHTQDTETTGTQGAPPPAGMPRPKRGSWLAGIGALIVVMLIIGASVVVFAQLGQRHSNQGTPTPTTGQWKQVLKGYQLASIVAARSNPAVLYACATASQSVSSQGNQGSYTLLRSTDFGDHWQDIGSKLTLTSGCQVAVNPADSNELYVLSPSNNARAGDTLKHSTDGGQTWETILPALHAPGLGIQSPARWHALQLQFEGQRLFAVAWVVPLPTPTENPRFWPAFLPRLVMSTDGGHNWTVLDSQFAAQRLGVRSFAVDPTAPNTIYMLLGGPILPIERVQPDNPIPAYGLNGQLYKTSDAGATWHLLLKDIPFGSQVQLATANPRLVYVGGVFTPLPLTARPGGAPSPSTGSPYPVVAGPFHLQFSSDGGATWHQVAIPSDMQGIQAWFVSASGQVYASPFVMTFSGQPTAIAGTAVVAPAATPGRQFSSPPSQGAPSGTGFTMPSSQIVSSGETTIAATRFIQRYDPAADRWSQVTKPPVNGILLQVTPASANGGAVLWFLGMPENQPVVYRFVV